jgi:hypothetical protein
MRLATLAARKTASWLLDLLGALARFSAVLLVPPAAPGVALGHAGGVARRVVHHGPGPWETLAPLDFSFGAYVVAILLFLSSHPLWALAAWLAPPASST